MKQGKDSFLGNMKDGLMDMRQTAIYKPFLTRCTQYWMNTMGKKGRKVVGYKHGNKVSKICLGDSTAMARHKKQKESK